jgi:hypothetical protein
MYESIYFWSVKVYTLENESIYFLKQKSGVSYFFFSGAGCEIRRQLTMPAIIANTKATYKQT